MRIRFEQAGEDFPVFAELVPDLSALLSGNCLLAYQPRYSGSDFNLRNEAGGYFIGIFQEFPDLLRAGFLNVSFQQRAGVKVNNPHPRGY
jgi:hypothetical protein